MDAIAVDRLRGPPWLLEDSVADPVPLASFEPAFDRGTTTIKTAAEFRTHEER